MDNTLFLIQSARDGDKAARDLIVSENTGLIWSVVKKFLHRGYEADDLFQIGAIGLIKCIDKFDLKYNVKFSTYAVPMIMGEIKRFLRDDGMIKVSRGLKETAAKARYLQEKMLKEGKNPTVGELAAALDTEPEELILAMESGCTVESLNRTISGDESSPVYLLDKLESNDSQEGKILDIIALKEIIGNLKARERQVIMLRYFMDKTQSEAAKIVGVSQVQISRIEKKVLSMLKEQLT